MKIVTVKIVLYQFEELGKDAQERAITKHSDFMLMEAEIPTREAVIEDIKINECYFYADGSLAPTTKYTGEHFLSGTTVFHFGGESYKLER